MANNGKEVLDLSAIGDIAATQLSDVLTNVAGRHLLPKEVYIMMTSKLGLESDIFTRPYAIDQDQSGGTPGLANASSLDEVGNLNPKITVAEHIESVASYHPGTAFILDQETATALSGDPNRPVTLIDYGDDHCLLTGLNARGIDLFLTVPMTVIRETSGLTVIDYMP